MRTSPLFFLLLVLFSGSNCLALDKATVISKLKALYSRVEIQVKQQDKEVDTLTAEAIIKGSANMSDENLKRRIEDLAQSKKRLMNRLDLISYLTFKFESQYSKQNLQDFIRESMRDYVLSFHSTDSLRKEDSREAREQALDLSLKLKDLSEEDRDIFDRLEKMLILS